MILKEMSLGSTTVYYVQKSFRKENGKPTTKKGERLGTIEDLKKRFGEEDPIGGAKRYVAELTIQEKEHRNKYDLDSILQMLLYTRILYPGSKLSSLEDAKRFIEQPTADIHQVYRALSLLAKESDDIQAAVYKNSLKLGKRNDAVIYYDCTNYYFESEEECGLRQYGHSKETTTLKPLEDCFRITKTDFEARPVFLQRDDRIRAHFLTCFLALILYKYLAKKNNRGGKYFTPDEIIGTLQDMNFLSITGEGYIPTYTRTDLTNNLHGSAGFRTYPHNLKCPQIATTAVWGLELSYA